MEHTGSLDALEQTEEPEKTELLQIIDQTYRLYFVHGPRSNEKVNYFHGEIKRMLERIFTTKDGFEIKLEYQVPALNSSGKKRCDIVVVKKNKPYIVFPVKLNMTNVKQNKNNSLENLTGDITLMRLRNPDIHFIPINIWMDKPPYLIKNNTIKYFESVTESDIGIYNQLKEHNLFYDVINYIVEVEHIKKLNERFDEIQPIKRMNADTPYRTFHSILAKLQLL